MNAGFSVKHILANFVRMTLDDYGADYIRIEEADDGWTLHDNDKLVGSVTYNTNYIHIQYKDRT